jgi:hypothetical protein
MASEAKVSSPTNRDQLEISAEVVQFSNIALGVGVVALGAGVALSLNDVEFLFRSYLVAFMYVLSIGLGSLWFLTINHLVGAKWWIVVRRVPELMAAQFPVIALLSLGIVLPMALVDTASEAPIQGLYVWLSDAQVGASHLLQHKVPYLNKPFFLIRFAVYFAFWIGLSTYFLKRSIEQDKATGEASIAIKDHLTKISAPSMIAFALTLTFCAFDMLMSLNATWFSTMFGVYYFAGCLRAAYCTMALVLMWLQGKGRLKDYVKVDHFHDIGKMMFATTVFWAYIGFSQFMLIWYADIPEETAWFHARFQGDWRTISTALLVCNFAIPFFGLLSRHAKRSRKILAFFAIWILSFHYLDLYWLIFPNGGGEAPFAPTQILFLVGVLAVFFGVVARRAKGVNLVPTNDPRLADSLAFENY